MNKLILTVGVFCVIIGSVLILCAGIFDVNVPKSVWLVWTIGCFITTVFHFYNLYAHNKKDK